MTDALPLAPLRRDEDTIERREGRLARSVERLHPSTEELIFGFACCPIPKLKPPGGSLNTKNTKTVCVSARAGSGRSALQPTRIVGLYLWPTLWFLPPPPRLCPLCWFGLSARDSTRKNLEFFTQPCALRGPGPIVYQPRFSFRHSTFSSLFTQIKPMQKEPGMPLLTIDTLVPASRFKLR